MGETVKKLWRMGTYHNTPFWICLIISIVLIITAFFIPPMAVVDGSVVACVGELFGFAALWSVYIAIDKGLDAKITHGNTEVHLINEDKDNDNKKN